MLVQVYGSHHGVGKLLPAASGMRGGFVCAHRKHGVQQQHALLGPAVEVAALRHGHPRIVVHLLEDVLQRRRERHSVAHREAEPVGLTLAVVGVLTYDNHLQIVEGALVECAEYVAACGKDPARRVFVADELRQLGEIGFVELFSYDLLPVFGYTDIHASRVILFLACEDSEILSCIGKQFE